MRKFLRKFFWSHGTPLGYLGSLSQKGLPEIFSKWFLINLSNPLRHPAPLVDPLLTKKLDTAGPWCVLVLIKPKKNHFNIYFDQEKFPELDGAIDIQMNANYVRFYYCSSSKAY